jgi:hypothetical protein
VELIVPDTPITLEATVTVTPEVVFKELRGEAVLLDLASGIYFGLDETSTRLWQLLTSHGSLRAAFDAMLEEFDVEPDRLREDLVAFVAELARRRLVSVSTPTHL